MSDVFEILGKSITRQFNLVEADGSVYLQIVYGDNSVNRFPVGCWFLNEHVSKTFSPEEEQVVIKLINSIDVKYLPLSVRASYEAARQKRLQQRSLEQAMHADYIRRYGNIPVFKEKQEEEKDTKKRGNHRKGAK